MTSKSTVARESVYSQKSSTGGIGGHARAGYSQSPFGRKDSTSFCAMVEEEEEEEKASEIASKKSALAKKQAEKKNRVSSVTNRKPEKSLHRIVRRPVPTPNKPDPSVEEGTPPAKPKGRRAREQVEVGGGALERQGSNVIERRLKAVEAKKEQISRIEQKYRVGAPEKSRSREPGTRMRTIQVDQAPQEASRGLAAKHNM